MSGDFSSIACGHPGVLNAETELAKGWLVKRTLLHLYCLHKGHLGWGCRDKPGQTWPRQLS